MKKESLFNSELDKVVVRIKKMEQYMDEVLAILEKCPDSIKDDESIKMKIAELENYQESGQWLLDYEADERGELPAELKRGVLSEDMLYNLLCDVNKAEIYGEKIQVAEVRNHN